MWVVSVVGGLRYFNPSPSPSPEMKKRKRIKSGDGEIPLPEDMIQHIQSFLSYKEAARTTILLSKSWYNAWLTRPALDFDNRHFYRFGPESDHLFQEFVTKTLRRYQNLSLKIDSFRLRSYKWGHGLIVDALKMGATAVELDTESYSCHSPFKLPQEVLGSETLLKLCLRWCRVKGNYVTSCWRLKSLTLEGVEISDDVFKALISCCVSMEELSVSSCYDIPLVRMIPIGLHNLKRLFLEKVRIDSVFCSSFSSAFPCVRDLHILQCHGCKNIQIASTSLQTICLKMETVENWKGAKFDVPNIRKFTYSCTGLPYHLSINGPSKEWEFDISVVSMGFHKMSWFTNLKRLLKKLRLSRISLLIDLRLWCRNPISKSDRDHEVDVEVVPKPLVVENLMIQAPPKIQSALIVRSLGAFRPKFITRGSVSYTPPTRVIQQLFVSNWQEKFGQFGLKKVNVEIRLNKHKVDTIAKARLQLIWED